MESVHLSSEDVAAYIDGRLAPAARRCVGEHLAACGDCFELYAETLYCLNDTGTRWASSSVLPFRGRDRVLKRWLPAAAAAVLVVAVGAGSYHWFVARPEIDVDELVQTLQVSEGIVGKVWTGETLRGADEDGIVDRKAVSFLVGAHLVGLQASLEAGDKQAADEAIARVSRFLKQAGFADSALDQFREARRSLAKGAALGGFTHLVDETSPVIESALPTVHLDFGEWAQAGRIAALSQREAFFDRRANRRFLTWLLDQDEETIDRAAMAKLRLIDQIWRQRPIPPERFTELADAFTDILELYEARGRSEPSFS